MEPWQSDDTDIVAVDGMTGIVTGIAPGGPISVYGKMVGMEVWDTAEVTVFDAPLTELSLSRRNGDLPEWLDSEDTLPLTATSVFENGEEYDATEAAVWTSSNEAVASVDDHGVLHPTGTGITEISATFDGRSTAPHALRVTHNAIEAISIEHDSDETPPRFPVFSDIRLTVIAHFDDGTESDVTARADFDVDGETAIILSEGPFGVAIGTSTIGAHLERDGETLFTALEVEITAEQASIL
jgi:hypothetical protein